VKGSGPSKESHHISCDAKRGGGLDFGVSITHLKSNVEEESFPNFSNELLKTNRTSAVLLARNPSKILHPIFGLDY